MKRLRNLSFALLVALTLGARVSASKMDGCPIGFNSDCDCDWGPYGGVNYVMTCTSSGGCDAFWNNTQGHCDSTCDNGPEYCRWSAPDPYVPCNVSWCTDESPGTVGVCYLCEYLKK
jgi:hypothetical protein